MKQNREYSDRVEQDLPRPKHSQPNSEHDAQDAYAMHVDALLHEHAMILSEAQRAMSSWIARHHEAMDSGFKTLRRLYACEDSTDIASDYMEWLAGSTARILAEIAAARDGALRLSSIGHGAIAKFGQGRSSTAAPSTHAPK